MTRPKSLERIANEQVPFLTAARWAGVGTASRDRGMKVTCPACGEAGSLRVYEGHGYCFAERRRFSSVTLLVEVWDMDPRETAVRALDMIGYVPVTYAALWENVQHAPEPAREELAGALRTWCEASDPAWRTRQYELPVAGALSRCLGLLPLVRTEEDCSQWLSVCKQVMRKAISRG